MTDESLLTALGPLAPLYTEPDVLEIIVDAPDRVYVQRAGQWVDVPAPFTSAEELRSTIDAILAIDGITLSPQKTIGELHLADGSRFLAVIPPTAANGPCCVLRRMIPHSMTWDKLFEYGAISREAYELLRGAINARASLLIAGDTASGKTTIANLLIDTIPLDQRVVIAEQVREIQTRHPRSVHLEAGTQLAFTDLLNTAARMRPDWLVIGELIGAEAMTALQIMGRGHSALTTIHATSPEDALTRLEAMCLMANLGLGLGDIRLLIASAIKLITHQQYYPTTGKRRITHIIELRGIENDRYVLQPLFRYNPETDRLEPTGAQPSWMTPPLRLR